MITYRTDMMREVRHLWPFMAWVQTRIPAVPYMGKLATESVKPLRCTSAWDEGRCVGTMMYWPAAFLPEAMRILSELEEDANLYIVRTNSYVHPEYRGRDISRQMYLHQNQDALSRGHEAGIGFGYENEEILSWALNVPRINTTPREEQAGSPVVLSKLNGNR